jgi:hypothetical protein
MDTVSKRPNNDLFGKSSQKESRDGWSGTKTYGEALEQFANGLPETAERLKKSLGQFKVQSNIVTNKVRPKNHYYGYAPNVAAAIIGLPKSMRIVDRVPQKTKTIGILWDCCQSCMWEAKDLRKAGETVLHLVWALETRGYRVKLDCSPFNTVDSHRYFVSVLNLKQFGQHMDILKLSFPVTSPAMFRRFGFKWAEGIPGISGGSVSCYGDTVGKAKLTEILKQHGYDTKSTYIISVEDCHNNGYDALEVAKALGIVI